MNVHKLKMDTSGNVEDITLVLAKKNGDKISNLTNITDIVAKHCMNDASELSCEAHKKMDDNVLSCWDELVNFKLSWIPEWDMWYEIYVEIDEKDENTKSITAKTIGEAELSQIMLYDIEINTETDIARDDYKIPTKFYNPDHPEASLVDRLMEKAPHYTITHIDKSLMDIQRTFTFDDTSLYDAFKDISEELDCLFVFNSGSGADGKPARTIQIYDLEANCNDCGYRNTYVDTCPKCGSHNVINGYGEYTNIFISKDNLADDITYSVDTDSVKNCFKLEAGDDLMTAAIRACNPNGSDYIYHFSDQVRHEMSPELQTKLKQYDTEYENYQTNKLFTLDSALVSKYNNIVDKYLKYDDTLAKMDNPMHGYPRVMRAYFDAIDMVQFLSNKLMPNITKPDNSAESQGQYLIDNLPSSASVTSLKTLTVSLAENTIISLARSIVKGSFKITVSDSTLSGNTWRGKINLKGYVNDDDHYTSDYVTIGFDENYQSYVKQRIDTILNKYDTNYYGIVGIFKQDLEVFKSEMKKYCLDSLKTFQKCAQGCIDLMVQMGVSAPDTTNNDPNTTAIYNGLYIPYYNKINAVQDEILIRQNEIYAVEGEYNNQGELVTTGIQNEIEKIMSSVQKALDFKSYIGVDLYKEFSSFLRMDKFSNENYTSDDLDNTNLFQNALDFINAATKELYKSSTLQHSITGTIKNFLRMKEFEPIMDKFKNGNWITFEVDEKIYQLRIVEYDIDFSDTQNIDVTFSDVVYMPDGMSDLQSVLASATKMATSYSGVLRQSEVNNKFTKKINDMISTGLDMTNTKIISNADHQDITWDEHGLLCREYNDILSDYNPSQLKIINQGVYLTTDNWRTAKAGIGKFWYYDPRDKSYKESYGVIADTLVSNLILTSEVGIYNEENSIEMAKNGIVITTNTNGRNAFTIRKEITDEKGNKSYERQLYIDDNGNIRLSGHASISWDNVTGTDNVVVQDNLNTIIDTLQKEFNNKLTDLEKQDDKKAETWYQESDPSTAWTTSEDKAKHKGDLWYDTSKQVTKIYNGKDWEVTKTTPPDEVFDKIDGKAQIFVSQPKPPYNVGDLWFDSKTSDIMTCTKERDSGDYAASDWEKRNKYTDNSELTNFVENIYTKNIKDLQNQVDGQIETFYYDYEPTLLNYPASEWTSTTDRKKHIGDLFYWKSKGYAYRFLQDGATWKWQLVQDTDITKAMQTAEKAKDIADGKRRVFVTEPKPPYDIGDLWTQGTSGDLMRCKTSRSIGNFDSNDWEKATKYTDDSSLTNFLTTTYVTDKSNIQKQIDGKIETFRQETDPSTAWTTVELKKQHIGDLWYDTKNQTSSMYNGKSWETVTSSIPDDVWSQIGSKAQIFTDTPKPAYNKGDLWIVGANGVDVNKKYANEILTCATSKADGTSFSINDWTKQNKYTDDTTANTVKNDILGSTYIDNQWVIAPNIKGGHLLIVGKDSSGNIVTSAEITSAGVLKATGAEISGKITATSGTFTGTVNANSGTFTNVDIQSGNIGGLKLSSNSITSSNRNFSVTSGGKLTAKDADISGNINAESLYAKQTYYLYDNQKDNSSIPIIWASSYSSDPWNINNGTFAFNVGINESARSCVNFQTAYSQSFSSCRLYTEQGYSASLSNYYYSGVMTKIENDSSGNRYSTIFLDTQRISSSNTAKDGDGQVSLGIADDGTPCFIPGNLLDNSFYSNKIALGTTSHRWKQLNAVDIYVDTIHFPGGGTMSSPASGGGKITNYLATAESIDYGNAPTVSTSVSSDGKTLTFNFNIPKGKPGAKGEKGATGEKGDPGVVNYDSISKLYNQNANDNSVLTLEGKNPWFGSVSTVSKVHLGHDQHRWANIYYSGKLDGSSDEHLKENITNLSLLNNVEKIYMSLHPISYRFKTIDNDQAQDIHFGFGARETEQIFLQNNIDISQYSCVTKNILESPNIVGDTEEYSMCYIDFIPLNTLMTQKAHHRIDSLESQLTDALSVIESLKKEIETIKQAME